MVGSGGVNMTNNTETILSAIRTFYPTYDAEPLSKQKNALAVLSYLKDNELLEGVVFAKCHIQGPCEGALWTTSKRLLFVGINRQSKSPVIRDHSFEKIIFIAAKDQKITLIHTNGAANYEDVDKKARLN